MSVTSTNPTNASPILVPLIRKNPEQICSEGDLTKNAIYHEIRHFNTIMKGSVDKDLLNKLDGIATRLQGHVTSFENTIKEAKTTIVPLKEKCCRCIPVTGASMKKFTFFAIICLIITIVASYFSTYSSSKDLTFGFGIGIQILTIYLLVQSTQIGIDMQNKSDLEKLNDTATKDGKKMVQLTKAIKDLIKAVEKKQKRNPSLPFIDSNSPPRLLLRESSQVHLQLPDERRPQPTTLSSVPLARIEGPIHQDKDDSKNNSEQDKKETIIDISSAAEQNSEVQVNIPPEEILSNALNHYNDLGPEFYNQAVADAIFNLGLGVSNDPELIEPLPRLEELGEKARSYSIISPLSIPEAVNFGVSTSTPVNLTSGESGGLRISEHILSSATLADTEKYKKLYQEFVQKIRVRFKIVPSAIETTGFILDITGARRRNISSLQIPPTPTASSSAPVTAIFHGDSETPGKSPSTVVINTDNVNINLRNLESLETVPESPTDTSSSAIPTLDNIAID